jgi:cyclase
VLFAGDLLFVGLTPLVFGGSVEGALRSLEWLAAFGPDTVVPGHGPVTSAAELPAVLADHERYYRFVLGLASAGRSEGIGPLEVARSADLGPFADWPDAERLVLNLHRAYAEADGVPLNMVAALDDAVAWNRGPLTTHVCCDA